MPSRPHRAPKGVPDRAPASVRVLRVQRDEAAIVDGVRAGEGWAIAALYDHHGPEMARVIRRLVGTDPDIDAEDLLHEAFVAVIEGIGGLQQADALRGWLRTIAVRTAYRALRNKRYKRWLCFWEPDKLQRHASCDVDPATRQAYQRVYELLRRMPPGERVPFVLRYIEELELVEVAEAIDVSLATAKRRLLRAKERFMRLAEHEPALRPWLRPEGEA